MKAMIMSLPWAMAQAPSPAVSALKAFAQEHLPQYQIYALQGHVRFVKRVGFEKYDAISQNYPSCGEAIFSSLLFPEMEESARTFFARWFTERFRKNINVNQLFGSSIEDRRAEFDRLRTEAGAYISEMIEERDWSEYRCVGISASFVQLFSSLLFAKMLKEKNPKLPIVMGGSLMQAQAAESVIQTFPFVDYVVRGEGEFPLVNILKQLEKSDRLTEPCKGVVSRFNKENRDMESMQGPFDEVADMDQLPLPDYSDYIAELEAQNLELEWLLPLEGSRGCWWDRTAKTGDPKQTCQFCAINNQWNAYRDKSPKRLAYEMKELSRRYRNTRIIFVDNILRNRTYTPFVEALKKDNIDYDIKCESRVNLEPYKILELYELGFHTIQFGIEALSTNILTKFQKGTSLIQNLQALKVSEEVGVVAPSNIITHFPGTTQEEVNETVHTVYNYAWGYRPILASRFRLRQGSGVDTLSDEYGLENIRNQERFLEFVPKGIWESLELQEKDFDEKVEGPDWSEAEKATYEWFDYYYKNKMGKPLLSYIRGADFVTIHDRRTNPGATLTLKGLSAEMYMYCMKIRTESEVLKKFEEYLEASDIDQWASKMMENRLLYRERGKLLSLACASTPQAATRRIREEEAEDAKKKTSKKMVAKARASEADVTVLPS